ncbi:MAG: metal ABC transporter ATP-binding protein [Solirubrobacterales bacterium]|nr:metal ABC transporter ATP-binding protein [Solirubrobacterales bacterium]
MSDPVIKAAHLNLGYEGRTVLGGLEFQIPAGSRVGILGPNGGGKTTLFRAIAGEITPLSGTLEVNSATATVAQTDRSRLDFPVSALDVASMGSLAGLPWWKRPGRGERTRALEALGQVGLGDRAEITFGDLSGGQRQRVLIARALTTGAGLLLMDEPFNGLDSAGEARLEELIDRLAGTGRTVMIATHEVEQAERWDLVLCLNHGQIAFGEPSATLSRPVLEATYGHILKLPGQPKLGVLPAHHHPGRQPGGGRDLS